MDARATLAVFRFEFGRAFTPVRLVFGTALACFPPGLVALIHHLAGPPPDASAVAFMFFILIPEVVCLMGLLLWATPAIHAELEGRTWSYLAVRSGGKGSVLLGKYLAAVAWTAMAAVLSLSLSVLVVLPVQNPLRIWLVIGTLIVFSCLTYGALYMLLGVVFLRRAMMVAVGYTFVSELAIAFIPAVINQFTVQYHLRSMLLRWFPMKGMPRSMSALFGDAPVGQHMFILLAATVALLTVAVAILHRRELVPADDN